MISAGLEPILSHTEKLCKAPYYGQYLIYYSDPSAHRGNKTGFNLI